MLRSGPLPQIVIHSGRNGLNRSMPNAGAPLVAETAGKIEIADQAIAHFLNRFLQGGRGAALTSLLHDAIVFSGCRDNLLRFKHVVGARLFDVDVFSSLASPDGLQCMAVVRRGDGNGIDVFVFEQLSKIYVRGGTLAAGSLLVIGKGLVHDVVVD